MTSGTGKAGTRQDGRLFWAVVFVSPALLYLCFFQLFPVLYALYISFQKYDIISSPIYVGLKNYSDLLTDDEFQRSCWITIVYVTYTIVPVIIVSFFLARALSKLDKARGFWRLIMFLPSVLPLVSVALIWKLMLNYQGPVNSFLELFNLDPLPWLTNSRVAPWALIVMSWWHATSYYTIIFLAGFLSLPKDVYEAADLDGARGRQTLWHITLPLMRTTILLVVVLSTVNGLKAFVFQKVLTDGGPANATEILTLLIYKTAFSYLNMGTASAYSMVLFVGILCISLVQIWLMRSRSP